MYLNDINQWQLATTQERLTEIEKIATAVLNFGLTFVEIKSFEVMGMSHDIAVYHHVELNMNFHLIPGSQSFKVGAAPEYYPLLAEHNFMDLDENDFDQQYPISISPFFISDYLITEGAWNKFNGKPLFRHFGNEHPIDAVSRESVTQWAKPLGLRLPSEMEWEYACKASTNSLYYWGNEPILDYAWTIDNTLITDDNYHTLTKGQQKPPNSFGLYGMIGNLAEWVADDATNYDRQSPSQTPHKAFTDDVDGILRGGNWEYDFRYNRSTSRIRCSVADTGCSARLAITLNEVLAAHALLQPR